MQKICDVFATIMEKLSILSILRRYQSYVFNILKWNHIVIRQFVPIRCRARNQSFRFFVITFQWKISEPTFI